MVALYTNFLDISCQVIDLTHPLTPRTPHWSGRCGFEIFTTLDYHDCPEDRRFRAQRFEMQAGIGTHMDAPLHCFSDGMSIADLPLNQLLTPCVVMDISDRAHASYSLTAEDVNAFETLHGRIPPRSLVIIHTGWEQYWSQPEKFHNQHQFPSVSADAAHLLLSRDIAGLGIDTLSADRPKDGFPVHHLFLGNGKYLVENVANAKKVPPVGAWTMTLPIKVADGTEAPIRLVALIKK